MAKNTVIVSVLADAKQFTKGLNDAGREASGLGGAVKGLGLAAAAGLAVAGAAALTLIASTIKAAGESEKIAAQTAAVVKSTGEAAGRSAAQISDLATQLSRISGIDDEIVQSGQNILLTFTNIKGTTFDAATQSALDMSVAMGTDLNSAALQVGKALNDPVAGMAKLSKVGVQFTQGQKDAAAAMVAVGDIAGAQNIIITELDRQFGGSAAAFGSTFEGSAGKAKTALGNLQEAVGSAFLPVATQAFTKVAGLLDQIGSSPAFAQALTGITAFISGLLAGDSAASAMIGNVVALASNLSPLAIILTALGPALPALAGSVGQLAAVLGGVLGEIFPTITSAATELGAALGSAILAVLPSVLGMLSTAAQILTVLTPVIATVASAIAVGLAGALTAILPMVAELASWMAQNAHIIGGAIVAYLGFKAVTGVMLAAKLVQQGFAAASYGSAAASYANSTAAKVGAAAQAFLSSTVVKGTVGWIANTAAQVANAQGGILVKAAVLGGAIATGVATAAQWLFNAAMSANPIGIVVVAIGALVAALVWVATQTTFFQDVWKATTDFLVTTWTAVTSFFTEVWGAAIALGLQTFVNLQVGLQTVGDAIAAWWTGLWSSIGAFFAAIWSGLTAAVRLGQAVFTQVFSSIGSAVAGFTGYVGGLIGNVIGFFTGLPGQILGALGSLGGSLGDVGRNMIQGLIKGATGMLGNLASFVSGMVSKYIVNPVNNLLGIRSPSRVFAQIGTYTMEGLEIGLSDTSGVRGAVDSLGRELANTTLPAPRVSSITGRPSALDAQNAAAATESLVTSQMTAADRAFFRDLFREFAGSLTVTDGVIAQAAHAANARLVKAGVR